jgi:hypothetical protein
MKNKVLIILSAALVLFTSSCKKTYTCYTHTDYLRPVGTAFVGFSPDELDTIFVAHYRGGTHFSELLGRDTIISSIDSMLLYHDTVYIHQDTLYYPGFWLLRADVDDSVLFPETGRSFTVTGTHTGGKSFPYSSDIRCSVVGDEVLPMNNIHIDGTPVTADVRQDIEHEINAFIYLKK